MSRRLLTGANFSGQRATNLADGVNPSDAVTKAQLEAFAKGLVWKAATKVATTANITLSGTQTIDGVAVAVGDRVLVKNQTTASANGIYVVATSAWTRATDLDESAEFTGGVATFSQQGTTNADKSWVVTNDGVVVVGTDAITWSQFGGSVSYSAGNGLSLSGTTFAVAPKSGGGLVVDGTGVSIDGTYSGLAKRFSSDVAAGSTSVAVTHNLATTDVHVQVRVASGGEVVEPDINITDANTVTLGFATAPTTGQYRVVVIG